MDDRTMDFLAGGGTMGRLIRSHDWAATPLGPVAGWPQSLKITVRIMLDSRYAMWLGWGPDFIFFCNDAYLPTLGVKQSWALGASARTVWAEIWDDIGPRAERVLRGGGATWDEGLLLFLERRGFPEETYHTFSYSPVPDDRGRVGGMLCVVTEDTERTIGERRLRTLRELSAATAAAKTAATACDLAAAALAANPHDLPFVLIYLLDDDARTARLAAHTGLPPGGPAAPEAVALDRAAEPGWPFADVFADGRAATVTDVERRFGAVRGGPWPEPVGTAVVLPVAQHGPDERPAGFFVAGVSPRRPLDDGYRGFLQLVAGHVSGAVSDARAYERERARAEALAELDRAKTAFFSNVSHEFRTPLTLMLGPVEEMLAAPAGATGERDLLAIVHRNGLRLQKLVNTLLDFSRIEAGRARASYEPVDLAAATADLASNFRSACDRAGLALAVDCPPVGEPVYVDREMWEKVVLNLLSNAFKFTLAGGIAVSLRRTDGTVELAVRDTGVGIPAEHLSRVFERFHRVEAAGGRTQEGSGIGLALVRELVHLHGGDVRAESTPGGGSTFTVRLLLGTAHLQPDRINAARGGTSTALGAASFVEEAGRWLPTEPAGRPKDEREPGAGRHPARPRVLLADDNADMRDYVRRLLDDRYEVEAVADGTAALAAARRHPPDAVVSDVMMPGLDGFGLLRALRADPTTVDVPVLLLSARAGEEARVEGLTAGADDYLTKPFGGQELLARVGAHMNLARLRRAAREELRESEERFRLTADTAPVLIWVSGRDGGCTYVNKSWRDFTGRTADQETGTGWAASVHLDDRQRCLDVYQARFQARQSFEMEYRLRRADGDWRWVLARGVPRTSPGGEFLGYTGSCLDITDRKRAADIRGFLVEAGDVLSSSLDYEATLAAVARLVVPRLADWCSVYMAEPGGGLRQLAVAHSDPTRVEWAREFGGRYPPDPTAAQGVPAVIRSGEPMLVPEVTDELLAAARDPAHLATLRGLGIRSVMIVPLPARSRTIGAITFATAESGRRYGPLDLELARELARRAGLAVDNARLFRETEDALRQLSLLVEAAGRLTSSLDPPAVSAAVLDLSRRLVAADAHAIWRARPDTGEWVVDESAGLSDTYLREQGRLPAGGQATPEEPFIAEDVRAAAGLGHRRAAYQAEGIAALLAVPLRVQGRVAGTLTFYYHAPRRFDEGTIRVATALADLAGAALGTAELYQSEAASRRRAEEADRRKEEFLALLGHELRNPLAPIRNAVQILRMKGDDPGVVARAREMIGRQAEQMARLVDELLDASRIARGKVQLSADRLDLVALVRTTAEDHRPGLEAAGLALAVETPDRPVRVRADAARLAQVVGNLIHNSQKFTDPGGRIVVRVEEAGGEAVLAVTDTGVGIDPAAVGELFEPFHQIGADPARSKGGLGLGLSVVKGLVELHGGRVSAASEGPGLGATFTARLPVDAAPAHAAAPGSGRVVPAPPPGRRRVLVVEDKEDTAESLRLLLELKGFEVAVAHTGPAGVEAARRVRPDAVVCDLGLPGMTGYEVARALRADPATAGAALICVSGYAQDEDRRLAREAGFDAHLVKPADPATLLATLAARLRR